MFVIDGSMVKLISKSKSAHTHTHTHTHMLNMLISVVSVCLIWAAICNWYVCARVCMCARGWGYQIIKDLHFAGNTEHKE